MIRYWIESAAAYPGTYAALGTGMIGGYPKSQLDTSDRKWPSSIAAAEAIRRRCLGCHDKSMPVPQYLSDDLGLVLSNPDPDDVRIRYSRHLMFNLSRPEKSLILLAPLAKEAGGYGLCRPRDGRVDGGTFRGPTRHRPPSSPTPSDPDYQQDPRPVPRREDSTWTRSSASTCPASVPPAMYVREMKRFGILPGESRRGRSRSTSTPPTRPTGGRSGGSPAENERRASLNGYEARDCRPESG